MPEAENRNVTVWQRLGFTYCMLPLVHFPSTTTLRKIQEMKFKWDKRKQNKLLTHIPLYNTVYISRYSKTHITPVPLQGGIISLIEKDLLNKHINRVTLVVDALGKSRVFCNHKPPLPLLVLHVTSWGHAKSRVCLMIKCLTCMRLWGCWPGCHSAEVIIICIRHDALVPKPWCLNKHLKIICVHLGLLFFGLRCSSPATPLHRLVIITLLSTMTIPFLLASGVQTTQTS